MVSVGFILSHEQFSPVDLVKFGQRAEGVGFDMVWTSDHFQPWMHNQGRSSNAWITLAALGQQLKKIPMGTGVTCPTYRYHPSIVAQAFASLGELYPGQVFLGVGTGEAINEEAATGQWGEYEERRDRLVEAVELIRQLWTGERVTYEGQFYRTKDAMLYDLPEQPIPIYIAASGDESMEIAGRYGDGLVSDAATIIKPEMLSAFKRGARAVGKNPDDMTYHAELFIHVGDRQSAIPVAEKWRFLVKSWDKYVDIHDPRVIQSEAEKEVEIDEVLEKFLISDDPQVHIDKINELAQKGVTHIYVHSGQEDRENQEFVIDWYGKNVLPKIDHSLMKAVALETV
jgi:TAT-translocated FGD2 family F420-dependent dehydrogenase